MADQDDPEIDIEALDEWSDRVTGEVWHRDCGRQWFNMSLLEREADEWATQPAS